MDCSRILVDFNGFYWILAGPRMILLDLVILLDPSRLLNDSLDSSWILDDSSGFN